MKTPNPKLTQYITQFAALYDGHPWFGDSICKILERVTAAKAYWQPNQDAHSIAQIISHMIYWRQALIKRLGGDTEYKPSMKSDDNWRTNDQLKKRGWKSLRASLDQSQSQMLLLISKHQDSLLKKKYSEKATYEALINGILQHDLYHTGQVAYLKSIYRADKK